MKKLPNNRGGAPLFMIIFLLIATGLTEQAYARDIQLPPQNTVSGTVSDADGLPLPGVHIQVESTKAGTISDLDGTFSIKAELDDILVFSIVGFKKLEVAIGGRRHLEASLEQDVTQLGEVVLNAGYYTVKERESTGSISKVTAVDIEKQPISSPLAALQGRMSGVQITQMTNIPGAASTIQIRGQNSIRPEGNYPLYIIDGVPVSSVPIPGLGMLSLGVDPLNTLNLNNIESIEVLKDADATAIYGSRGANGVVLITTKKGVEGKTSITLNAYSGIGKISNTIDVLNTPEYLEMRREAFANDGATPMEYNAADLLLWDQERETDWQETLLGNTAYISNVQASISGGNERTVFLVGGSLHKESLVFPGDFGYCKFTTNLSLGHTSMDKRFNLVFSANYGVDKNKLFYDSQFIQSAILLAPNAPALYTENGELNWENSTWNNPLANLNKTQQIEIDNLVTNLTMSYSILPKLVVKGNFGYSKLYSEESYFEPLSAYNPTIQPYLLNFSRHNTNKRKSIIVEPQLTYGLKMGKLKLQALVGSTFLEMDNNRLLISAEGYSDESLMGNLANATNVYVGLQNDTEYKYSAIFGRLGIDWGGKYFLNLTGRRDGSSRFSPENRFANFGAIGTAWIFSKEKYILENLPFISFGKLRGSYGITGNDQIADYGYLDAYAPTQGEGGLYPIQLGNPYYSWEENKKLEVGFSLGFFHDRLQLNTAWYRNRSSNQLVGYNLPSQTGFSSIQANLPATIENRGWELDISTNAIRLGKLRWNSAFNISWPRNELLEFPGLAQSSYANLYTIGESFQSSRLYKSLGVNPETGFYDFQDVNGDGSYNTVDRIIVKDFGRKYYGGFNNSFFFGNLQFNFFFEFVKQLGRNHLVNFPSTPGRQGFVGGNQPKAVLDRWQQSGDVASFQQYTQSNGYVQYSNAASSDLSVVDASYVRLKTLALAYRIPPEFLKSTDIEDCSVYIHAYNFLTLTNFNGLDPHTNRAGSLSTLPPLQTITMGVKFQF